MNACKSNVSDFSALDPTLGSHYGAGFNNG